MWMCVEVTQFYMILRFNIYIGELLFYWRESRPGDHKLSQSGIFKRGHTPVSKFDWICALANWIKRLEVAISGL